ncbi:transglutaminase domain-containing protein [Holdemanella biformis]|uniref:transglutaminase domain-containing protein n=1 Tax=Holdemanella biformis TaxID=1735 RepID=UPI0022DF63B4|nr:transglutaminase domain-containing protein [Holdemanella biformis]
MKKKGIKLFSLLISTMVFICNISFVKAEETSAYAYSDSATSNGVTLKVEWNEPVLGEPTTFHVSATGGSGIYKFNMEAPSYTNPDELAYESVADPSRGEWTKYTSECESQDYTFTMMATGTYNFRFHVMDTKAGVTYLRTNTYIQVSSPNYPSVNSIVQNAVTRCNSETNGSDYSKALWLHDWLLEQLDYDNSLKWSSAESALTRSSGTCQAYERAYAKLLSAAGIENAETRDTYDGHTWNAMKLDGKWYQVDCTWDDSSENYYNFNRTHLYFALSDELMAIAHQGHNKIYTVEGYATPSNSLEHNYFVQNGDAQQWVESYRNRIQENLNNKNTEFSIQADNSTYPPSIYGIQNGIIAYVMNQNEWFANGKKVELVAKTNDKQFDFIVTYPVVCTNHDWDEGVITTEPTCTTKGVKTYTCKDCKITKTEVIKALGHDYSKEWTIDKKATCTESGSKSHHCTRCDSKKDVTSISKKEHEWDNGTVTKESTNKETGIKTYKCKNCNDTKTEVIPVKKDESNVDSEAPVIDVSSVKLSTKSATTGDTVKISIKIKDNVDVNRAFIQLINYDTGKILSWTDLTYNETTGLYEHSLEITDDIPNGHWYVSGIQAYDAVNNVGIESFKRNEYGFIVKDTKADSESPVIDVNSIDFNTKSATTGDTVKISIKIKDNVGVNRAFIQLINYDTGKILSWTDLIYNETTGLYEYSLEITDDIPNGHWYVSGIQAYDAVNNVSVESFNHSELVFIVTRNNVDVHKWNNGAILQQPTCTKKGETIFECSVCHETKTETIKALGHDYSKEWTIDKKATCKESGSKSHHCTRCDSKSDVTVIPKTSHNYDDGVITTKATCTKSGVKTFTCKDCKTTKTEVINALGHDYSSDWTIDKKATCTESGSKSHHCTRCDSKIDVTVIPKTSHNYDDGVITTNPTCTKTGVKTFTCKDCKTTKIEELKALGHDYSKEWTIDKKATCTESGSKSHHCTRCDSKTDVTVIPKTSHNWNDGVITTKATCTKDGIKTYTCKDCKTTKTEVVKALGHDYSKDWTIDKKATCLEEGSKSHRCTRCDSKSDVTVIPKLSHDWILTSTVNPTRDHEGKKVYTCNLCKETKEESIPKLVGKWVSNSVGKWYEYSDGTYENSGFKKIENETYYFTSNGYVKTGWLSVNNNWYFFKNSGCMVTSNWAGSYYMGSEGKMKTNAFTPDGYYCGADGVYVRNAWVNHNGNYYYMDANGLMTKNAWVGDYYLGADGVMKTNTFTPDGYYVGSDGAYYRNRWIKYENKYYYTNSAGLIVKNAWIGAYYLGSDGVMIVNSFTPDGYYVGADGAYLRNQKIEVDGKEYYLNAVGKVAKNQWVGDYFIDMNGNVVKNHWAGNYWCGADGRYVKSSWVDDGRYYVGPNGVYVTNQWIGDYYLNGAGLVTKNAWVGNYWCGSDGKYVKSSWVDNNQYYVGANGVYVPGRWVAYGSRWCYYAGSVYAKDITLNINGIAYTFDCNGYMK